MNYSVTQAGNLIRIISGLLVLAGFTPFTPEQESALVIVIGIIGEIIGSVMAWYGRYRQGDLTLGGFHKS